MSRCGECPSWVKEKCDENLAYDECIDMLQDVLHELPSRPSAVYAYLKNKIGDIVDSETEFDAWFKRMVWHVKECDRLAREPKQGEWIPCSERLPSEEERKEWIDNNLDGIGNLYPCLVTRYSSINPDRTKNNPYVAKHYFDGEDFVNGGEEVCSKYILAWMPLPEPWKGAEEEG